jgi:hypothetical protein
MMSSLINEGVSILCERQLLDTGEDKCTAGKAR